MPEIVVINASQRIDQSSAYWMVRACDYQMRRHVAPAWGRAAWPVKLVADGHKLLADQYPILLMDHPDQPGVLGWHSEDDREVPFGRVFADPVFESGGVLLRDPSDPQVVSVASVLSHEVAELSGDPDVSGYTQGPKRPEGNLYANELCDPVEATSYDVRVWSTFGGYRTVAVSDFVLPAWFSAGSAGPWSYRCSAPGPFQLAPGGYMVVRGPGGDTQVMGDKHPPAAWRLHMKLMGTKVGVPSRTSKRHGAPARG